MPKKTKKEKIIAQYRKRLKFLQSAWLKNQSIKETEISQISEKKDQPKEVTNYPSQLNIELPAKEDKKLSQAYLSSSWAKQKTDELYQSEKIHQYFFQDLRKSLFLSFFVIALEICLYFVRIIK